MLLVFAGAFAVEDARCEAPAPACPQALSAEQRQALVRYVGRKYKLPDSVTLTLKQDRFVSGTCYRELTFQGTSDLRSGDLALYASPDLRFLTTELLDTQRDPVEEERDRNEALMKGLTEGAGATRGPAHAPATIVEFSDFQCPFCRSFAQTLNEALANETGSVRVVFRHLPLSGHVWPRRAAEGAACAQLQSAAEAFWALHDQLFRHQQTTTPENIREKLYGFAKDITGLDARAFQQCMSNSRSLGLVLRDLNLAEANQVNGTPTCSSTATAYRVWRTLPGCVS
jgi:Thioredoxin